MENKICFFCKDNESQTQFTLSYEACPECINIALRDYNIKFERTMTKLKNNGKPSDLEEYVIGFGKNRGKKILDVEPNYIKWCLENFEGLRDIEMFQKALEFLTGKKVDNPAAMKVSKTNTQTMETVVKTVHIEEDEDINDFPF